MNDQKQAPENDNGFTRFERGRGRPRHIPTVSIQPNGSFRITPALLTELGNPTHMAMLYNRERALIALEPTTADDPDGYRVRVGKGAFVSAAAFLSHIGLRPPKGVGGLPARVEGGRIVFEVPAAEVSS